MLDSKLHDKDEVPFFHEGIPLPSSIVDSSRYLINADNEGL